MFLIFFVDLKNAYFNLILYKFFKSMCSIVFEDVLILIKNKLKLTNKNKRRIGSN